jgi:hypothetical protein
MAGRWWRAAAEISGLRLEKVKAQSWLSEAEGASWRGRRGDWHDFMAKLDKYYPRQEKATQLSFDYGNEEEGHDDGKGL